jgi:hypothetical protein
LTTNAQPKVVEVHRVLGFDWSIIEMSVNSLSETAWVNAFVARLAGLGATEPRERLIARARQLWALIADVDPEAVARQEFRGWAYPISPATVRN